jgi:hypothetical protein
MGLRYVIQWDRYLSNVAISRYAPVVPNLLPKGESWRKHVF